MSVDQGRPAAPTPASPEPKPSAAVLALADVLASLPKALPLANDAAGLRAAFDQLQRARDALRGTLPPSLACRVRDGSA